MANFFDKIFPNGIPNEWVTGSGNTRVLNVPFAAGEPLLKSLKEQDELAGFDWEINSQVEKLRNSQPDLPLTTGNVIVVSSGKGGVGKSSVSVNLALALSKLGAKVGLLDADIYGPSIPTMLGKGAKEPELTANNKMVPMERHGIYVHSLGYLVDEKDATIWRGPMASGALQQLYKDTAWPNLDYLIVDMPPGTGDIQLTMAQKLPVTGAIVVTTPQSVALRDAEKGIAMFNKLNIPMIGVLENMSYYQCPSCGHEDPVFGQGGGFDIAKENKLPVLGQWPLSTELRDSLDGNEPLLLKQPEHKLSQLILESAQYVAANLYYQQKNSL
ncbi:iron-sulfur cluster carrier protein ApbC [Idiomarina sp.]|uniref:iron-sulfur cluster carrier protein ApbC n=1 Tax=Idiomarina sp. TaxID=1874361 RepID=UPI0026147D49|nr:iron-sulfur cluster carrier protein ApbC [Idiomarina sp.]